MSTKEVFPSWTLIGKYLLATAVWILAVIGFLYVFNPGG
jgi:hypothetical protein